MSEHEGLFRYIFRWHSQPNACPKCVSLHGRVYRDQDLFAPVLLDGQFGPIWNLDVDRSMMHGQSGTCRCRVEVEVEEVDLSKLEGFRDFWLLTEIII